MILDFDLEAVLRMSWVKRWGIVEMSRNQTVAEHSFNVAMISIMIFNKITPVDPDIPDKQSIIAWALCHDLHEVISSDLPTTIKPFVDMKMMLKETCPDYYNGYVCITDTVAYEIVKSADFIDAMQFADKFCVDERKDGVIKDIIFNFQKHLEKSSWIVTTSTKAFLREQKRAIFKKAII